MAVLQSRSVTGTVDSCKNEENKKELFSFIITQISKADMDGKLLLSISFKTVLSNKHCDITTLQP